MAICVACDAEIETGVVAVGDTITCVECGAEMEVLTLRPLELELIDDAEEEEEAGLDDDEEEDDAEEEEEEELAL